MDSLQGMPGDEDGGGMSAFVVFSMMGFYPVTPGIPVYDIGSPVFEKVTIHLRSGKDFVLVAHGASRENKYVESVRLNGKLLEQVWFRHAEIANGGRLELTMGDAPNRSLGTAAGNLPPASMDLHAEDFAK
jgi:putative alpha-1,2-mannosidase